MGRRTSSRGQLAHQRLVLESRGIRHVLAAQTDQIAQLGHEEFGAVAMRRERARRLTRQDMKLFPKSNFWAMLWGRTVFRDGDELEADLV